MLTSFANSFFHELRQSLFGAACVAAIATTAVLGCARSVDPVSGSETHFLEACNMSCGADLECVDGQCSKRCSNDAVCTSLNQAATCEEQPSGGRACEVGCIEETDCTRLRSELSCYAGVCRGPLWQLNNEPDIDASNNSDSNNSDASSDAVSDTSDTTAADGSSPPECNEVACPPDEAMYFALPAEGLGNVRLEFMFNLGETLFTRCSVEFVDDEMTSSSCESDAVAAAVLDEACPPTVDCSSGALRFDVRPVEFEVTYWQDGYQVLPLDTTTWVDSTFSVGPQECDLTCSVTHLSRQLPTTKGARACLDPQSDCGFGLGCGDRASALQNAPACDSEYEAVRAGEGCGYDVLIFQRYIESASAFYDKETGAFVGYWHMSDTYSVDCSGQVPFDCTQSVEAVDICSAPDAGPWDSGAPDADTE